MLFWKMKCDTVVLLWQPEVFDSETWLSVWTCLGTWHEPDSVLISPFAHTWEGFIVCVCTEQAGLLYLCRAAEAASSSSQCGPFTYPFCSHISSPPPSLFLRIKWLFVLPLRCLSLVSPPLPAPPPPNPSLKGMKGYFGGQICSVLRRSQRTVVISASES